MLCDEAQDFGQPKTDRSGLARLLAHGARKLDRWQFATLHEAAERRAAEGRQFLDLGHAPVSDAVLGREILEAVVNDISDRRGRLSHGRLFRRGGVRRSRSSSTGSTSRRCPNHSTDSRPSRIIRSTVVGLHPLATAALTIVRRSDCFSRSSIAFNASAWDTPKIGELIQAESGRFFSASRSCRANIWGSPGPRRLPVISTPMIAALSLREPPRPRWPVAVAIWTLLLSVL
jgi:hypothetical protein